MVLMRRNPSPNDVFSVNRPQQTMATSLSGPHLGSQAITSVPKMKSILKRRATGTELENGRESNGFNRSVHMPSGVMVSMLSNGCVSVPSHMLSDSDASSTHFVSPTGFSSPLYFKRPSKQEGHKGRRLQKEDSHSGPITVFAITSSSISKEYSNDTPSAPSTSPIPLLEEDIMEVEEDTTKQYDNRSCISQSVMASIKQLSHNIVSRKKLTWSHKVNDAESALSKLRAKEQTMTFIRRMDEVKFFTLIIFVKILLCIVHFFAMRLLKDFGLSFYLSIFCHFRFLE